MALSIFLQRKRIVMLVAKCWSQGFPCLEYSPYFLSSVKKQKYWPTSKLELSTNAIIGEQQPPSIKQSQTDGPKTKNEPKITLIGHDDTITITTLQEAQKISRRRDLKLVKMIDFDTKTQRAVYKLMTGAHFFEEEKKQRQLKAGQKQIGSIKREKLVSLSYRISEHDLQSRIKNIQKWLAKHYEVRVVISGEAECNVTSEKIYKLIENGVKESGQIVQKREKGNDLKFQILPPKQSNKEHTENKTELQHTT